MDRPGSPEQLVPLLLVVGKRKKLQFTEIAAE